MPDDMTTPGPPEDELSYAASGLPKTTNWWGAFVIGLAGTILVTGIAPVMVTELGAASVTIASSPPSKRRSKAETPSTPNRSTASRTSASGSQNVAGRMIADTGVVPTSSRPCTV